RSQYYMMSFYRLTILSFTIFTLTGLEVRGQDQITWSSQIACIIYSHCSTCHNDGGIAPFSLMNYDQVYASRFHIQYAVTNHIMPPWPPDPAYNRLAHERILSDEEIELINQWVNEDAPLGNQSDAPNPPVFETNLEIPNPDIQIQIPTYTVPAGTDEDLYRCFVLGTNESVDRFITGIEIIPGNRNIVHHVLVFQDTTGVPETLDNDEAGPGYTCFGGIGSDGARLISGWVPGGSAYFTPPGMGVFLPAGANLIVQLHFPEGSVGQQDSTKIHLQLSEELTLRRMENLPILNHSITIDRPLLIPANTVQTFHQEFFVPFNLTITGIAPHAHLLCTSMTAFAIPPSGDTIKLIHIPEWDFEWQGFYSFRNPIRLPFGTRLHGLATYDNTDQNDNNPNSPPRFVTLGEATTDEMMLFFTPVTFYSGGDENIVIDDSEHMAHHNDCQAQLITSTDQILEHFTLNIYPNPFHDAIEVEYQNANDPAAIYMILTDLLGHEVHRIKVEVGLQKIQYLSLLPGLYILNTVDIHGNTMAISRKVIKL
ncbi:MAG: T9SS type A sorting domain-containing protein, partial [Saprospiraceae bacterium]|nr:T9SS type A sorting domain-containing protein [Saprospiraceae bacterium]